MKPNSANIKRAAAWIWERTSALVAVLLIVAAFALGFWLRGGDSEVEAESEAATDQVQADDEEKEPQLYTCSMHPQVRLPDPEAKCPICFMDLIAVAKDLGEGSERRIALTEAAVKLAKLDTTIVGRYSPTATVRLFGKITYDQTRVARITSYFSGRLDRLFVDYVGTPVRKGDHLAEIYSPELLGVFEEVRQARLAVEESRTDSELVRSMTRQTLDAGREKLRLFGLTSEQIHAAERGEMTGDLFTVYSPIGGIVTHLAALEGDYVKTGTPVATVADLSRLWLDMEAYESQLPLIRWGQRVTFTVESNPGENFEGRVSFIEPMVDDHTRTAAVRVTIDNADGRLKPGMFATAIARTRVGSRGAIQVSPLAGKWVSPMHPEIVKDGPGKCDICGMDLVPAEELGIVGDSAAHAEPLVVPKTAVLVTGARAVAYVKVPGTEKPTFEGREVVLGPRAGDFYVVREGLEEGEEVVTHGAFKIDSAMQIAAKPSMMLPGGGSGEHEHHGDKAKPGPPRRDDVPEHFNSGLESVLSAYLDIQEALADDDFGRFVEKAGDLKRAVSAINSTGVVGESLDSWRRAKARLTPEPAPNDIDAARIAFEPMSQAVIDLLRDFGHRGGQTLRLTYCPMAFDDKGAEWVQRGDVIDNPYFGAEMLRCGLFRGDFEPVESDGGDAAKDDAVKDDAAKDDAAKDDAAKDGEHDHE